MAAFHCFILPRFESQVQLGVWTPGVLSHVSFQTSRVLLRSVLLAELPDALLSISITNEPEMPRTRLITESPATTTLVYTVHRTCARSSEDWIFCYGFTHDSVCKVYACMDGCMLHKVVSIRDYSKRWHRKS